MRPGSSGVGEFRTRLSLSRRGWRRACTDVGVPNGIEFWRLGRCPGELSDTSAGSKSSVAPPRGLVGRVLKEMLQHGTVSDPVAPLGVVATFRLSGIRRGRQCFFVR
jgi:hypothetical protein